jgi:hypothetical protein
MRIVIAVALSLVFAAGAAAAPPQASSQSTTKRTKTVRKASPAVTAADVQALKDALAAQQQQIQQLQQQMQQREAAFQQVQQQLQQAQAATTEAQSKATAEQQQALTAVKSDVADLKANSTNTALTLQETQKEVKNTLETKLSDLAHGKVKIGATFYGSFSHYNDAGFAPAFQDTPTIQLPPGNSGLNAFEVTRAYFNLFYTPDEHVTLRITPDIYRSADNSYTFRLKYAFVDFQKIFGNGAFKKSKLTFGQTQNPLIDWEEGLSGHRYVYLVPWNYLSLSSTYSGAKLHGPIERNGKEYLDYDVGVFNTASFHATETNDKKQVMARLSWYPLGTTADRTGFGLTAFEDYGYNTKLPSQKSTALNRLAVLVHYQTHDKGYEIVGEYDLGHNATSTGNLFSGSGAPVAGGPFDAFNTAASTILSGASTRQQGFDFFGHARLGHSPFSLFGFFQHFQPNTNFHPSTLGFTDNPLDFERTVGGISYRVTSHFDFAIGDQNFRWVHPQGLATGGDTNAIVFWTQFNY